MSNFINTLARFEDTDDKTRLELLYVFLASQEFSGVAQIVRDQLNVLVNARVRFITMTAGKGFYHLI